MPLVEYKCQRCSYSFAKLVLSSSDETVTCPNCHHQQISWRVNYTTLFKVRKSSTKSAKAGTPST